MDFQIMRRDLSKWRSLWPQDPAFKAAEQARWKAAQPKPIVGTWKPTWTEQEKREHEAEVIRLGLPF